jgi:hypothetical protein
MIYSTNDFINHLIKVDQPVSIIIGVGNMDIEKERIFDKTRFVNKFDFCVTNDERYIDKDDDQKIILMDISINSLNVRLHRNIFTENLSLKTEKISRCVVDWSTMKFVDIGLLLTICVCHLDINGEMFIDACIPHHVILNRVDDRFSIKDDKVQINNFGKQYLCVGYKILFKYNILSINYEDIVENNRLYIDNKLNSICDNFKIEYICDDNYPNYPTVDKKVKKYFKITKLKKVILEKGSCKSLAGLSFL